MSPDYACLKFKFLFASRRLGVCENPGPKLLPDSVGGLKIRAGNLRLRSNLFCGGPFDKQAYKLLLEYHFGI